MAVTSLHKLNSIGRTLTIQESFRQKSQCHLILPRFICSRFVPDQANIRCCKDLDPSTIKTVESSSTVSTSAPFARWVGVALDKNYRSILVFD